MKWFRHPIVFGLCLALVSAAGKLLVADFGLPYQLHPDEAYILTDPFRLTARFLTGNFADTTNLFFWIVQIWFGLLFVFGKLAGMWHQFAEFSDLIAGQAPLALYWGRLLGLVFSSGSVFVFYQIISETVRKPAIRGLLGLVLAVSPLDLVSSPWMKFDGAVILASSLLMWVMVRYLASGDPQTRRRLYVLAWLGCSLRIDLGVFLAVLVAHDIWVKAALKPVLGAFCLGMAAHGLITLMPVAIVYRHCHPVTVQQVTGVTRSYDEVLLGHFYSDFISGRMWGFARENVLYYVALLVMSAPAALVPFWPPTRADRRIWVGRCLAGLSIIPIMVYPGHYAHFLLVPFTLLLLVSGWCLDTGAIPALRQGILTLSLVTASSLSLQTIRAVRATVDPRIAAGRYMIAHSLPSDMIAMERYMIPGLHAEVPECPADLAAKAAALQEMGQGSGKGLLAKSRWQHTACRPLLDVSSSDRYTGTRNAGRWGIPYEAGDLWQRARPPLFYTTDTPLDAAAHDAAGQPFVRAVLQRYALDRVFTVGDRGYRLNALLHFLPYTSTIYVYRYHG